MISNKQSVQIWKSKVCNYNHDKKSIILNQSQEKNDIMEYLLMSYGHPKTNMYQFKNAAILINPTKFTYILDI